MSYDSVYAALVANISFVAITLRRKCQNVPSWFKMVAGRYVMLLITPKMFKLYAIVLQKAIHRTDKFNNMVLWWQQNELNELSVRKLNFRSAWCCMYFSDGHCHIYRYMQCVSLRSDVGSTCHTKYATACHNISFLTECLQLKKFALWLTYS